MEENLLKDWTWHAEDYFCLFTAVSHQITVVCWGMYARVMFPIKMIMALRTYSWREHTWTMESNHNDM